MRVMRWVNDRLDDNTWLGVILFWNIAKISALLWQKLIGFQSETFGEGFLPFFVSLGDLLMLLLFSAILLGGIVRIRQGN